jgi:hypothetical protein
MQVRYQAALRPDCFKSKLLVLNEITDANLMGTLGGFCKISLPEE